MPGWKIFCGIEVGDSASGVGEAAALDEIVGTSTSFGKNSSSEIGVQKSTLAKDERAMSACSLSTSEVSGSEAEAIFSEGQAVESMKCSTKKRRREIKEGRVRSLSSLQETGLNRSKKVRTPLNSIIEKSQITACSQIAQKKVFKPKTGKLKIMLGSKDQSRGLALDHLVLTGYQAPNQTYPDNEAHGMVASSKQGNSSVSCTILEWPDSYVQLEAGKVISENVKVPTAVVRGRRNFLGSKGLDAELRRKLKLVRVCGKTLNAEKCGNKAIRKEDQGITSDSSSQVASEIVTEVEECQGPDLCGFTGLATASFIGRSLQNDGLESDSESHGVETFGTQLHGTESVRMCTTPVNQEVPAKKGGTALSCGKAERVLRYLSKRAVLLSPPLPTTTSKSTITSNSLNNCRFTGHSSKAPRKTSVTSCSIMGSTVEVTLTNDAAVVDAWVVDNAGTFYSGQAHMSGEEQAEGSKLDISTSDRSTISGLRAASLKAGDDGGMVDHEVLMFGMDVEWRPNRWPGSDNKVALLQLSNGSSCLLVQMLFLDSTPKQLVAFLQSPRVRLGGVGVLEDARKLARDHAMPCEKQVADLNKLAVRRYRNAGLASAGLKKLAEVVLGQTMAKCKKVTVSNWAMRELSEEQVRYATMDAWISYAVLMRLSAGLDNYGRELKLRA